MASTDTTRMAHTLRSRRLKADMSLQDVRDELLGMMPKRYVPSISKLSRMETGKVAEAEVDGIVVNALAAVYKCKVEQLSPTVAAEMDSLRGLLIDRFTWITRVPDPNQASLLDLSPA